jgi:hypothetical protein
MFKHLKEVKRVLFKEKEMQPIKATTGRKVSKENIVSLLVREGGILFKAYNSTGGILFKVYNSTDEIPDSVLLDSCYNVIEELGKQKGDLIDRLAENSELTQQFYAACARINVTVGRDEYNKIELTRV